MGVRRRGYVPPTARSLTEHTARPGAPSTYNAQQNKEKRTLKSKVQLCASG